MEGLVAGDRDRQGFTGRRRPVLELPGGLPLLAQPGDWGQAIGGGRGGLQEGPKLLQVQVPFAEGGPLALALLEVGQLPGGQQPQVAGGQRQAVVAGQDPQQGHGNRG